MSHSNNIETIAEFVDVEHPAFTLQFWPTTAPSAHIIYLPPFAEEMNRCRSLVANQARWFASNGRSCTILDFYGTGESQGDLEDATLSIWQKNLEQVVQHLTRRYNVPMILWGCRLGALVALDFATRQPTEPYRLLFWQPVTSGKSFLTQMLRQRTASLMQSGRDGETTAQMKLRLAAGEAIEVAGYCLGGALATAIDQLEMSELNAPSAIFWLEHCSDDSNEPGTKSHRVIEHLQGGGAQVTVSTFTGDPIWQLHKRGNCDDLLNKTRALAL